MKVNIAVALKMGFLTLGLCITQCAPKIFHVDRHSLMEEEGSGKWPDFKTLRSKKGPSALPVQESEETKLLKADQ